MSDTPPETEPAAKAEHDVVMPVPGAPIAATAPWHNAPGTGAYESPPVEPVTAYEKDDDGQLVAKVIAPPARPRPTGARRASTPKKTKSTAEEDDQDDDEEA